MRLGALLGPIVDASAPNALADQARRYAGEGFESLWSAQAIGRGAMYTDPIVALSVAAAVTEQVELGTAVVQVPLYHPVDLAHRVLSLRQVAGDRLLLGVGAGSTQTDFDAFDRDYASRFRVLNTSAELLRQLFEEGRAGEIDLSAWPAVLGGLPLLLGSWGNGVVRAATDFDGWIASAHYRTPDQVIEALEGYRAAGGKRAVVSTILLGAGTELGETGEMLTRFAEAGFDDAVVMLLPGGPSAADVRRLVA
ncbi:MAG: LLM class flavin-dependent oxidoreductase [Pseudomonadales bacterium]|nr:LLM class flavin-dependent oxidoreductase [Pseudomonadales bacterium]NIX07372.1 LLM class flavin-dependent oxidoreductase [Pseudomonadales bacterium]